MTDIAVGKQAPDFVINNFNGQPVSLADYRGKKHVVLAFLRGFA
jgi:peroxiredoxin (alkyl hydroperoxide reductase subunit C)